MATDPRCIIEIKHRQIMQRESDQPRTEQATLPYTDAMIRMMKDCDAM